MAGRPKLTAHEVWNRPESRLGYSEGLRGLGGVVAPLLAGFSLAAIAQISTADKPPPLADWSIAAFACAVALLLFAIQLAFAALTRDPTPSTHLDWYPEALVDEDALAAARRRQANVYEEMVGYWFKSNVSYDWGVISFLTGLLLLLVPHDWSGPRIMAIALASLALLLELWWALANRIARLPHPVFTRNAGVELDDLGVQAMAAVLDPEKRAAAGLPARARVAVPDGATPARAIVVAAAALAVLSVLTGPRRPPPA